MSGGIADMAETVAEKGKRLLDEARLIVRVVGDPSRPGLIMAECRGDSGVIYKLGFDAVKSEWRCTCEARTANCSHLLALKLVVVRDTVG
jgi:hypothetical protein